MLLEVYFIVSNYDPLIINPLINQKRIILDPFAGSPYLESLDKILFWMFDTGLIQKLEIQVSIILEVKVCFTSFLSILFRRRIKPDKGNVYFWFWESKKNIIKAGDSTNWLRY